MAIDVGAGAAKYDINQSVDNYTFVDLTNPANAAGTLDTFEVWALENLQGFKIGTFSGSGTSWNDRDYESIGNVTAGSKQTFSGKNCDVAADDRLGCYWTVGSVSCNTGGGSGVGYVAYEKFGGGANTYTIAANLMLALYSTGTEAAVGWTHITKVNGIASANIAKVNGIAVANIAKVNNVAV